MDNVKKAEYVAELKQLIEEEDKIVADLEKSGKLIGLDTHSAEFASIREKLQNITQKYLR